MLTYNPCHRLSTQECLEMRIFDKIRVPKYERPADFKISQKIYDTGTYDYDKCKSMKYKMQDFKKMLIEEIRLVKQ